MQKIFFKGPFFPKHEDNLMEEEGNVIKARQDFLSTRFNNLDFLLSTRYKWMNKYLKKDMNIIEIGAGAGFSKLYLNQEVTLTDAASNPWIDRYIDATNMELPDNSVDIIIASHTIHHFYNPAKFFFESLRVLKKDGYILISEINTSFFMRLLLRVFHHEGYSYDIDIFNTKSIVNDKNDLWSANCAVPEILFTQEQGFENFFGGLKVQLNEPCEFLLFPLSGGVISKTKVPRLPNFLLKLAALIDKFLIKILPSVFALGRKIVIKKE
jgi:SAM-dependent methyltransferase